jgi:hypothetical protein
VSGPAADDILGEGDPVRAQLARGDRTVELRDRLQIDDSDLAAGRDVEPMVKLMERVNAQ